MCIDDRNCVVALDKNNKEIGCVCLENNSYSVYAEGKFIGAFELCADEFYINPLAVNILKKCFLKKMWFRVVMKAFRSLRGRKLKHYIEEYSNDGFLIESYFCFVND